MVVIQPSGAMTTVPQGYAMPGQPAMYVPQQVNIYLHFKDSFTAQIETLNARAVGFRFVTVSNESVHGCTFISLLSLQMFGSIVTFWNCLVAVYFMLAKWFDWFDW